MTYDTILFVTMLIVGLVAVITAVIWAILVTGMWPLALLILMVVLVVAVVDSVKP